MRHRRESERSEDGDLVFRFKRTILLIALGAGLALWLITLGTSVAMIVRPPASAVIVKTLAMLFLFGSGGTYCLGVFIYKLITNPQLVLTNKAVVLRYGSSTVIGEIQYRHIAAVTVVNRVEKNSGVFGLWPLRYRMLKIVLIDDDDEMTYWPAHAPEENCAIEIEDEYAANLPFICKCIRERVHDCQ